MGYEGGTTADPDYHHIGDYTETVRVVYDPAQISYSDLLEAFWAGHDPVFLSYSMQYRSVIFYHSEEQRIEAEASRAELEERRGTKIYTDIVPAGDFYTAEDYHQKYYLQGNSSIYKELRAIYPDFNDFVDSTAAARINGYMVGYGTPEQVSLELDSLGLSEKGKETVMKLAERGLTPACPVMPAS